MTDRRSLSLEYAPSLSSIAASTSSPSTADASPRLGSVLTLSTQATSSTNHSRAPRRSLSLLGKIPKDFSSLLRSHSSSRRNSAFFKSDTHVLSDYADERPYDRTITAKNMYARKDDERQTRKQKPESRFYSFLTRSRSRSRPKNDPALDHESIVPELARDYGSHSRQSSASIREKTRGDKISINPASRPLSTTTTATNTTIMPPTPKARRAAAPLVAAPAPAHPNENTSRPSTPKLPSNTRKKLHNIFGIPLSGPRKSDSRKSSFNSSRPCTPDLLVATNAPPLPATSRQGSGHDPIRSSPRRAKIPLPLDIVRSESPSLGSRSRQATFDSLESSTSTSASTSSNRDHNFKSQKLFLARIPSSSHFDDRPGMSSGAPLIVSGPHKHRRMYTSHSDSLPVTPITSSTPIHRNVQAPQPRRPDDGNSVISGVPRITHTPATPQRAETTPPRLSQRKNSLDSSRRHLAMSVVDEERSMLDVELDKGKRRGDTSRQGHHSVVSQMKSNRPGWGTGNIARSPSGNSTSTTATGPKGSGSGETLPQAARSGEISGKGKMRDMSTSDVLNRRGSRRTAPSPIPPLEPNYTGTSASTTHSKSTTGTNGQSSSLGRSTGKRMLGSGVAKLVGIPHGPFSFEPPVPSPTVSTSTHASGLSDYEKETEERGKVERRRKRREVMREEAEGREKAARRAESKPAPIPTSVGFRSATKGRSLDLGLGLSWAPTKVREDALLPSSTFALDKRSFSGPSRVGMRRNWSHDEEDESKLGKDIAEKFRNALDTDGYTTFKQYVHRFDAHEIPIDGPHGIIARARRLLDRCSRMTLTEGQKDRLTDDLFKIILQNA
ncbi:hypothetical protein CPB85DRAFT_1291833 [Mucidula mucida]|nr:hypothetical protein CPB85DRAFT_1291833 [Mucidula mucida]